MAKFELKLPKMGESVAEATITTWLKAVGERIEEDDAVLEIATDKVDSEIPSEVEGVLVQQLFAVDDVVQVGQTIAIIETDTATEDNEDNEDHSEEEEEVPASSIPEVEAESESESDVVFSLTAPLTEATDTQAVATHEQEDMSTFYSPLVKNIAATEGVSETELAKINGTGKDGRVTKHDILQYIAQRDTTPTPAVVEKTTENVTAPALMNEPIVTKTPPTTSIPTGGDERIEMTRMGKLIAHHMTDSLQTSAHVQSFIEADVTAIWNWRKKVKEDFFAREGEQLTFTPIFMEAVTKALKDFPMMNSTVEGNTIIKKKAIHLGMAAALPDGNLIVPVIKNADQLNLVGMTKAVNDLANRARNNQLKPDDIQDGTYTVTNVGIFGSIMGTPIINQPQVGILALGAIRKVPAVIETPEGDFIGIRHRMFLSHSYDHRVINGALGGQFVQRVKEYLEAWDMDRVL